MRFRNLLLIPFDLDLKKVQMEKKFPDEIFIEFFQYISVVDLYRAFYGLNHRLNSILMDRRVNNLGLNLFIMSCSDHRYLKEYILPNQSIQTKITYVKTDDWISTTNRPELSNQLLSKSLSLLINHYPNLRSLVLPMVAYYHIEQLLNLPFESRQQLTCLKLEKHLLSHTDRVLKVGYR
ncbi:unnamed protein product [Didymodactylos carnosus]|uniref:Uncharacterized protein n=1 Tax=Didymodactylos carnosus TaxID=1234261 RepID=A0A8S2H4I4_9BILA|nr:unnamed protein product [Didymodactylos carnosus]CAF3577178.1 unnamed protein product [Didymodactylos carnosus]